MTQHQDKHPTHLVGASATAEQDEESRVPYIMSSIQAESNGLFVGVSSSTRGRVSQTRRTSGISCHGCIDLRRCKFTLNSTNDGHLLYRISIGMSGY